MHLHIRCLPSASKHPNLVLVTSHLRSFLDLMLWGVLISPIFHSSRQHTWYIAVKDLQVNLVTVGGIYSVQSTQEKKRT